MFRNSYQRGRFSILFSCGPSPLEFWDMKVKNGYIRRVTDGEVKSLALELAATNVATTYIFCPKDPKKSLGIRMPFLVLIIKNMKKYFTFEITVLDDKNINRRFRVSNFQSVTRIRPFCTSMPIGLSEGWNRINFNLADFTRRAYGSTYVETIRMQIHANCRIRRIYFADRLYQEHELPDEFKLFFPLQKKTCIQEKKQERKSLDNVLEETLAVQTPTFDTGSIKTSSVPNMPALPLSSPSQLVETTQDIPKIQVSENSLDRKETSTIGVVEYESSTSSENEIDVEAMEYVMEKDEEKTVMRPMSAVYETDIDMETLELEELEELED